jgi:hypothetical protein
MPVGAEQLLDFFGRGLPGGGLFRKRVELVGFEGWFVFAAVDVR